MRPPLRAACLRLDAPRVQPRSELAILNHTPVFRPICYQTSKPIVLEAGQRDGEKSRSKQQLALNTLPGSLNITRPGGGIMPPPYRADNIKSSWERVMCKFFFASGFFIVTLSSFKNYRFAGLVRKGPEYWYMVQNGKLGPRLSSRRGGAQTGRV